MISAANPLAAEAGRAVLRAGGSAVDAAVAAALVLAVVEPQASGLGGGGFLVAYDPSRQRITTLDGRETAPAATKPDRFLDAQGKPLPFRAAVRSGRSVGVPGVPALLTEANARFGRRPWSTLVDPAIRLAEQGFAVSPAACPARQGSQSFAGPAGRLLPARRHPEGDRGEGGAAGPGAHASHLRRRAAHPVLQRRHRARDRCRGREGRRSGRHDPG